MAAVELRIKSVREPPAADDGQRILVDRLWPRGVNRERAALNEWLRDLAPSQELRHWFGHDPERFDEFARRYEAELAERREELSALRRRARQGRVTLLFGARDSRHNNAVVLAKVLRRGLRRSR